MYEELKTLEDIEPANIFDRNKFSTREGYTKLVDKEIVKKEAIKWVQEWYKGHDGWTVFNVRTFMKFHNIAEEDLSR